MPCEVVDTMGQATALSQDFFMLSARKGIQGSYGGFGAANSSVTIAHSGACDIQAETGI